MENVHSETQICTDLKVRICQIEFRKQLIIDKLYNTKIMIFKIVKKLNLQLQGSIQGTFKVTKKSIYKWEMSNLKYK